MNLATSDFKKDKRFLVCVNSDGCVMDTMEVKHRKCFAPKAIEIWELKDIEDKFLDTWNRVNLYSDTRGTNRFKGLVKTFKLLATAGVEIPDFSAISEWTKTSKELSNAALTRAIMETENKQLIKALQWSQAVNRAIKALEGQNKPFPNVKRTLKLISSFADVVIVSSAHASVVSDEWTRHELAPYVQVMLAQEAGSKTACIASLKRNNYYEDQVLMVGDAPGDLDAAINNGVLYYPILIGKEGLSWERLVSETLPMFIEGNYRGEYQQKLIDEFNSTLK